VIAANSDSAYERAVGASRCGRGDRRRCRSPRRSTAGEPAMACVHHRRGVERVFGTRAVRGCTVTPLAGGRGERLRCDLILMRRLCAGRAPAFPGRRELRWLGESAMFVPDGAAPGPVSVGACAGVFARRAGGEATRLNGRGARARTRRHLRRRSVGQGGRMPSRASGTSRASNRRLQNDVLPRTWRSRPREFRSVEHLKRYTTPHGDRPGKSSIHQRAHPDGRIQEPGALAGPGRRASPPFARR